jgi:hypothetical protein
MVPVLARLKATGDEIRRLICARYEFLGCATPDEQQEFLQLLSANNSILGTTDVSEISRLNWTEPQQEQLWNCVLTRLSSEDGKWWQRTSIAETLVKWARTPDQRARIAHRLIELLSCATDTTALHELDGLVLMPAGLAASRTRKPRLPDSPLNSSTFGKFVRFVRTCDLPRAVLRDAHDILVAHAASATTLGERAGLLECAGALLPHEAMTAADTERALALLQAAQTPDDGARSQRALLWFRPTIQELLAIPRWPAPPTYDLLRVARRSACERDWYSLLQHLADSGLLAATTDLMRSRMHTTTSQQDMVSTCRLVPRSLTAPRGRTDVVCPALDLDGHPDAHDAACDQLRAHVNSTVTAIRRD